MPTARPSTTTGKPLTPLSRMICSARRKFSSGCTTTGSNTMPLSARLTFCTSRACCSTLRFLWMTPSPPSRAMVMAVSASVTVSIADDTSGICSEMRSVSRVRTSTSRGNTSDSAGNSSTSSKVSASGSG